MKHKTRAQIESVIHDMTVGQGEADEKPIRSDIERHFGRQLTEIEWSYAQRVWSDSIVRMEQL